MRKKFLLMLLLALFCVGGAGLNAQVAKVGNTEYTNINDAINAWTSTNKSTLTLLADVTLSGPIQLQSKETHTLNLGTYTMTAASGKNAIEFIPGSNNYGKFTINADANNPGGITANGKNCIHYNNTSTCDLPIITINGGVFNGAKSIYCYKSKNPGGDSPMFVINNGTFNADISINKGGLRITGGFFDCKITCQGATGVADGQAYRLISGGTFKEWGYMTSGTNFRFAVGSTLAGPYDVGVYVDDNGYLVVGGPVITEAGTRFKASSTYSGWSSYLQYSSAYANRLYYTSEEIAKEKNKKIWGDGYNNDLKFHDPITLPSDLSNNEIAKELVSNTAIDNYPIELPNGVNNLYIIIKEIGENKIVFDVIPKNGQEEIYQLSSPITFPLPVPAAWAGKEVYVSHDGTRMDGNVQSGNYVEVTSASFPEFAVEFVPPVAKIGDVEYTTLQAAVEAANNNDVITLLKEGLVDNVTVSQTPDVKFTIDGAGLTFKGTITVDGKSAAYATAGVTIQNVKFDATAITKDACINLGVSGDSNTRYTNYVTVENCTFTGSNQEKAAIKSYQGGDKNLTVTGCTVDNTMHSLIQVSNITGVVVDNCTVKSKNGINLNSSSNVEIKNSTIEVSGYAVRAGVDGGTSGKIELANNTLKTNGNEDAVVVIRGTASEQIDLTMTKNVVSGITHISGTTAATQISADANYWDGNDAPVVDGVDFLVNSYYSDAELTILVKKHYGNDFTGYTSTDGIWGEVWGNAFESFVIKVLDANNNVMGTTSLNNIDGIIDGDVNVTWNLLFDAAANTDSYWTMGWTTAPNINNMPAKVELWVDGVKVSGGNIQLNGPDNLNPIVAAVTYENGDIKSYATSLANAFAYADNNTVVVLRDITLTETATIAAGKVVTLDLNGKTISQVKTQTAGYQMILNDGNLTIEDSSAEKSGKISYTDSGNGGEYVSNTITNRGTITVKGGTIENLSSETVANNGYPYAIDSSIWGPAAEVNTIVEGGKVIGQNYSAIRMRTDSATEAVNVTVTDGEIVGTIEVHNPSSTVAGKGKLTISGGKLSNSGTANVLYFFGFGASAANIEVEVTGGEFTGIIKESTSYPIGTGFNKNFITGGTFTVNPQDFCHVDYTAIENNDGTFTVKQTSGTQTREFTKGWNWFSSYVNLATDDGLEKVETALGTSGIQIKGQTNNQSATYEYLGEGENGPLYDWIGSFTPSMGKMYMVKTSAPVTGQIYGDFVPENTAIALNKGWNWISYPLNVEVEINEALKHLEPEEGDVIKMYGSGFAEYFIGQWWPTSGIETLKPGLGYMYKSAKSTSFVYSADEVVTTTSRSDDKAIDYRWTPEASEYAFNMSVIATLNVDGEMMSDGYEIAAFANGECRGSARPIYIERLDQYMLFLTIYGDEVEELTFKCYDVNYGTEYELSNRFNYSSDAVLGSMAEPYMFNMNFLNIEESSLDMINIYPNPTTTDRAINLQATCDNVEVFNALGVKVAEYQNVDTIDALETAGVYVIRVTINGETRNCRLVVK